MQPIHVNLHHPLLIQAVPMHQPQEAILHLDIQHLQGLLHQVIQLLPALPHLVILHPQGRVVVLLVAQGHLVAVVVAQGHLVVEEEGKLFKFK